MFVTATLVLLPVATSSEYQKVMDKITFDVSCVGMVSCVSIRLVSTNMFTVDRRLNLMVGSCRQSIAPNLLNLSILTGCCVECMALNCRNYHFIITNYAQNSLSSQCFFYFLNLLSLSTVRQACQQSGKSALLLILRISVSFLFVWNYLYNTLYYFVGWAVGGSYHLEIALCYLLKIAMSFLSSGDCSLLSSEDSNFHPIIWRLLFAIFWR